MPRLASIYVFAVLLGLWALSPASAQTTVFGDSLFSFNAGLLTPTQDYSLRSAAFVGDHFWVLSPNAPYYNHPLYKIAADGSEVVQTTSLGTGYHAYADLSFDGEFLYATDRDHIAQIDTANGLPTGVQIPADFGVYLAQGVAYDPATDHFWVIPQRNGQLQVIHEMDRSGSILNTFPNLDSDYTTGLTWDVFSPGGPFLWTCGREEIGRDSRSVFRQFSPAIGTFTGVEIEIINRSEYAQDVLTGCAITDDFEAETVTMIGLQAGSLLPTDGLDWIVVYNADLEESPTGAEITVNPTSIETEVQEGETVEIPVFIGNLGNADLSWAAYVENADTTPPNEGELGDVLTSLDLVAAINDPDVNINSFTFTREHIWASGYSYFGDEANLYKIDLEGNLVATYPIGGISRFGWRTITSDDDFIYGSDTYSIAVWSIDGTQIVDQVITYSINPSGLTFDPDNQHFYLGDGNGTIEVYDRNGDEVRLVVTPYEIEGIAWDDVSPGGPFLWAWVGQEAGEESCCEAIQLDPVTGIATGVRFGGENQGSLPSVPEAATITRDFVTDKLAFVGLQESSYNEEYEAFAVAYDLAVTPPPSWIDLMGATVGRVEPKDTDTLFVAIHGTSPGTKAAVIRIASNDLNQPLVEIPVSVLMFGNQPTSVDDADTVQDAFVLEQNFPNPFGPQTRIRFALRNPAEVTLDIFDILGRRVSGLRQEFESGLHEFVWESTDEQGRYVPSGVYLYTLSAGGRSETREMILIR